jgi:large-conductance mechanosensitive channel
MTPNGFLRALRKQLKGISPKDEDAVIEEIGSHIERYEEDPGMGKNAAQVRQKLMTELGSPEQMGKELKKIHQADRRVIDFLVIAASIYLLSFLGSANPATASNGFIGDLLIFAWVVEALLLIVIGRQRRSALLMIYGTSEAISYVVAIFRNRMLANCPPGIECTGFPYIAFVFQARIFNTSWLLTAGIAIEIIFWFLLLTGLIFLFARLVRQNRHDLLIMIYAILPIISIAAGVIVNWLGIQFNWIPNSVTPYLRYPFTSFTLGEYAFDSLLLVTWAPFFLARNRTIRWSSLAFNVLLTGVWAMSETAIGYPLPIYYLWMIRLAVVFLGWWLERTNRWHIRVVP